MKEIEFKGKVAVVTGAGSGMGLRASQEFARLGATVVLCDVNAEALSAAVAAIKANGGKAIACTGDVRKWDDAMRAAAEAGKLGGCDILVTCAGGNEARCCKSNVPFYEQSQEVIDWGLDVNLKGAVYFARACMPQMVAKKKGVIVCLGSVTGFEGDGVGSMYGTAKSGLFNFVKGLAIAGSPQRPCALRDAGSCPHPGGDERYADRAGAGGRSGRARRRHPLHVLRKRILRHRYEPCRRRRTALHVPSLRPAGIEQGLKT